MNSDLANNFCADSWRDTCARLAGTAVHGCGLSHDVFVQKFSLEIELLLAAMNPESKDEAIKIAREHGYATQAEISEEANWNAEHGYCQHGIEKNCCPAGCGDLAFY